MEDENTLIVETTAGKLYAMRGIQKEISYVEIGYLDEKEKLIPLAAVEVQSKGLDESIDDSLIWRVIYNSEDPERYQREVIN